MKIKVINSCFDNPLILWGTISVVVIGCGALAGYLITSNCTDDTSLKIAGAVTGGACCFAPFGYLVYLLFDALGAAVRVGGAAYFPTSLNPFRLSMGVNKSTEAG